MIILFVTLGGAIIEFADQLIEEQQLLVAKKYNFILKEHVMTIYGVCETCQK